MPGTTGSGKTQGPANQRRARELGAAGEARAAAWLESQGYRIVGRNVRAARCEIDLIVERGATLAFVEVKTRSSTRFGRPEEAVDLRKQRHLVRAATHWLREQPRGRRARKLRFDVVSVVCEPGAPAERWRLTHLPDAFEAGE